MGRKAKKTQNQIVADWLIGHRWRNSLNVETIQKMPAFVDDAVMSSIYIVSGTSNGKVNISPKLVFKCLMLHEISTESVRPMEVGYDMSERHAQRLAQTVRFALDGIRHKVQEYESRLPRETLENIELEKRFVSDYYLGIDSTLYSPQMVMLPIEISTLRQQGKYLEYGYAVRDFRCKG